ncbi:hypothetical protein IW262DRAFT_397037 [Armillaria fumosa]|nr:hypothetical protein IW262DRAFT_397037 [Armillaria fumosa]
MNMFRRLGNIARTQENLNSMETRLSTFRMSLGPLRGSSSLKELMQHLQILMEYRYLFPCYDSIRALGLRHTLRMFLPFGGMLGTVMFMIHQEQGPCLQDTRCYKVPVFSCLIAVWRGVDKTLCTCTVRRATLLLAYSCRWKHILTRSRCPAIPCLVLLIRTFYSTLCSYLELPGVYPVVLSLTDRSHESPDSHPRSPWSFILS